MSQLINKGNNVFEVADYESQIKTFTLFAMVHQHRPEPTLLHDVTVQMGAGLSGYRISDKPNCRWGERMYGISAAGTLILLKFDCDSSD